MSVATSTDLTDIELLHLFLGRRIERGEKMLSVAQAVEGFVEYKRELDGARQELRKAELSSAQRLAQTVDREHLKQEVRAIVAQRRVAN